MGFMDSWKAWSQRQYNNWGSQLQPQYTQIKKWDAPDWVKDVLEDVWDLLEKDMQKKLYNLVMDICKEYDAEFAKTLIEEIKKFIKKLLSNG